MFLSYPALAHQCVGLKSIHTTERERQETETHTERQRHTHRDIGAVIRDRERERHTHVQRQRGSGCSDDVSHYDCHRLVKRGISDQPLICHCHCHTHVKRGSDEVSLSLSQPTCEGRQ